MVKTHEFNIKGTSAWNQLVTNKYLIIKNDDVNVNDYILFKNVETDDEGKEKETGLYQMTQVSEVIQNEGLKEGYVLIIFNKI